MELINLRSILYRLRNVVTTLLLVSPLFAQQTNQQTIQLRDPMTALTSGGLYRIKVGSGSLSFQKNTQVSGTFNTFLQPLQINSSGEVQLGNNAVGSPFTQTRLSVYKDGTNWGYLTYGTDAVMRIVYSSTATGSALSFGTSSNNNGTGTYTETLNITGTGRFRAVDGAGATPTYSFNADGGTGMYRISSAVGFSWAGTPEWAYGTSSLNMKLGYALTFGSSSDPTGSADTSVYRDSGAGLLAMANGGGTDASFRVYGNTSTPKFTAVRHDGSNGTVFTNVGALTLFTTGADDLAFGINSTAYWKLGGASGDLITYVDNTRDIGASGANRPRSLYLGTSISVGTNPASTGAVRIPNNTTIYARNAANSGDLAMIFTDTSNNIGLGATALNVIPNSNQSQDFGGTVAQWNHIYSKFLLAGDAAGGVGYTTGLGAGGTVTQATSKSTGVTLNKVSGQITMNNAALAAGAKVTFTVTDSSVAATDIIQTNVVSGGTANAYRAAVTAVASGSFAVTVENITAGSLSEAPVVGFVVIKGSTN